MLSTPYAECQDKRGRAFHATIAPIFGRTRRAYCSPCLLCSRLRPRGLNVKPPDGSLALALPGLWQPLRPPEFAPPRPLTLGGGGYECRVREVTPLAWALAPPSPGGCHRGDLPRSDNKLSGRRRARLGRREEKGIAHKRNKIAIS